MHNILDRRATHKVWHYCTYTESGILADQQNRMMLLKNAAMMLAGW